MSSSGGNRCDENGDIAKLNLRDRVQAVVLAYEMELGEAIGPNNVTNLWACEARVMKWIESAGGPMVVMPQAFAGAWRGFDDESGHYALASSVVECEIVEVSAEGKQTQVLVLWDEPMSTSYDPEMKAILQWRYSDSEEELLEFVRSGIGFLPWEPVGQLEGSGPWVIFDAAFNGSDVDPGDQIVFGDESSVHRVEVAEAESERVAVQLVRLVDG